MGRHKSNSGILSNSYIYVRWLDKKTSKISYYQFFIRIHMRKLDLMQGIEIQDMD